MCKYTLKYANEGVNINKIKSSRHLYLNNNIVE